MNKKFFTLFVIFSCGLIGSVFATGIDKNTAKMQAMDKITGRVSVIEVPVGGMVHFGSLSIVVRSCKTRPMEEAPDNFAFVDISDKTLKGDDVNIFRGWMISSSPATHAVEHPIYDVWLLSCLDQKVNKKLLLTEAQLSAHENLPRQNSNQNDEDDVINNTRPIAEMQEDKTTYRHSEPQQLEFSYDEADEAGEEVAEDALPDDLSIKFEMQETQNSDNSSPDKNEPEIAPLPIMTQDDDANIRIFDEDMLPKVDSVPAE